MKFKSSITERNELWCDKNVINIKVSEIGKAEDFPAPLPTPLRNHYSHFNIMMSLGEII
jgi:hypothetical protein